LPAFSPNEETIMGKIGPYEYPDVGVLTALEVVETIVKEKTEKIETLATKLGHANANSGGFRAKLAACQRYGFLLGKSTSLNVSSLAKRLVHPKDENERSQLLGQAILNVDLFRRIHDKVGTSIPSGEFWVTLADIVEAEREEVMANAPKIESIYRESLPILARYETPSEAREAQEAAVAVSSAQPAQPVEPTMATIGMQTLLLVSRSDGLELHLPRTRASVELARKALDLVDASLNDANNSHQ
jgi:hypothetical protein